ncbi:MAG: DUF3846 domain-containing protein [Lachnospiraceae bacterium]|nr:DUF3846 domain-containing protein [Lachnospiraceae bacterium]
MENKLRVMIVEPYQSPYISYIGNELKEIQSIVGYGIEMKTSVDSKFTFICSRYGKTLGLPETNINIDGCNWSFCGTFVIVRKSGEKIVSLDDSDIELLGVVNKSLFYNDESRLFVYQVRENEENIRNRLYMNYRWHSICNLPIVKDQYRQVYTESFKVVSDEEFQTECEKLYIRFNQDQKPKSYYGHSLSVSDILVFQKGESCRVFFCDSIGYVEIDPRIWEANTCIN